MMYSNYYDICLFSGSHCPDEYHKEPYAITSVLFYIKGQTALQKVLHEKRKNNTYISFSILLIVR